MTRLLSMFLVICGLALFLAPQSSAEGQPQPPLIKIYKAPG